MIRFLLIFTFISTLEVRVVQARIRVNFPTQYTVIQRNQQNEGLLHIGGSYTTPYSRMEARLVSRPPSATAVSPWIMLETPAGQGIFRGSILAKGGWYTLEIRGISEQGQADTLSVQPLGIGEVFLVAGHSNAMGLPNLGAKDGSERVVSFNALNKFLNNEFITVAPDGPMPVPAFSQLKADKYIFPSGESAWTWGELGAMLADRLKVPVLFMNAGWAAANSFNWREAAEGKNTLNIYIGKNWPNRQPYSNLINTLRYYHSWLGIRTVLWFHGENDAANLKISQIDYFNNIRKLIELTRKDFGRSLAWAIAICSVTAGAPDPYLPVLNAQIQLSEIPGFNAWRGPYADSIQVPRPAHGHFENVKGGIQGLTQMALAWNRTLTDAFFAQRPAYSPGDYLLTGLLARAVSPGHSFLVPFQVTGKAIFPQMEVHLLDQQGNFVNVVGNGSQSPLRATIPATLPEGNYRLRVVAQNPTLPGSTSELFNVEKGLAIPQSVHSVEMQSSENQVTIHALVAADPDITQVSLERSDDRQSFQPIRTLPVLPVNASSSALYTLTDPQPSTQTAYYRIRLDSRTRGVQYSPLLADFRGDIPQVLVAFPNPISSGEPIYLRTDFPEEVSCQLFDMKGTLIPVSLSQSAIIGLSILQSATILPPGMYLLQITYGNTTQIQRIVVR